MSKGLIPESLRMIANTSGFGQVLNRRLRLAAKSIENNAKSVKKKQDEIKRLNARVVELDEINDEIAEAYNEDMEVAETWLADKRRAEARVAELEGEIVTPEILNFMKGIVTEAAHQRERWGEEHDKMKTPEDWLWVLAYLSTKATQAARYKDHDKYLHHIITSAALCLNWHKQTTQEKE